MKLNLFSILIFFSFTNSHATEPKPVDIQFTKDELCKNLGKLSCKIKTTVVIPKEKMAELDANSLSFADSLLKTSNDYYKRSVLQVSGLNDNADSSCKNKMSSLDFDEQCYKQLKEWLAQAVFDNALGGAVDRKKELDAGDMYSVMALYGWPNFNKASDAIRNAFLSGFENKENMRKIQIEIFPDVKSLMIKNIEQNVQSETQKKLMIDKINAINMSFEICGAEENKQNAVPSMFQPNASYNLFTNQITFCKGKLLTKYGASPLSIAAILAHELTHSIDMCGIAIGPKSDDYGFRFKDGKNLEEMQSQHPYGNVLNCLRRSDSIEAKIKLEPNKKPNFCNKTDQINESFCDWMAAEISAEYSKKITPPLDVHFARGLSPICPEQKLPNFVFNDFNEHPETEDRINKILAANPKVREQMGCKEYPTPYRYCSTQAIAATETPAQDDPNRAVQSLKNKKLSKSDGLVFYHNGKQTKFELKNEGGKIAISNGNQNVTLNSRSTSFMKRELGNLNSSISSCPHSYVIYAKQGKVAKSCFSIKSKKPNFPTKLSQYLNAVF